MARAQRLLRRHAPRVLELTGAVMDARGGSPPGGGNATMLPERSSEECSPPEACFLTAVGLPLLCALRCLSAIDTSLAVELLPALAALLRRPTPLESDAVARYVADGGLHLASRCVAQLLCAPHESMANPARPARVRRTLGSDAHQGQGT